MKVLPYGRPRLPPGKDGPKLRVPIRRTEQVRTRSAPTSSFRFMVPCENSSLKARLYLFGGPRLVVCGDTVELSPLQAALLGPPFVQGEGGITRAELIHLLWEEDDGPDPRHRLSQLLYTLKGKTRPISPLEGDRNFIWPRRGRVKSDFESFRTALKVGELQKATAFMNAGFLRGLTDVPTRAYEEWKGITEASLRSELRERASVLLSQAFPEYEWSNAEQAAASLLSLHPRDESLLRKLVWARAMTGRIASAAAAYQSFAERAIADDPDWQCEEETTELMERLGSLATQVSPPPELQDYEPEPQMPLVGRDDEIQKLSNLLSSERSAPVSTVLVTGSAGIGKTRLIEEATKTARLLGFRVFAARSSEFERDIHFNPLLEALDTEETGAALHSLEDPWRSVLLSLMPRFHKEDGPLPDVPYVQPGSVPRRMFEALRFLLQTMAQDTPLLLFFDDFHWADETSVAALEFVRRRWNGERLVIMLTLRTDPFRPETRADCLARELQAEEGILSIVLEELSQSAARSLIKLVAHEKLSARDRSEIFELAGGNPFFLIELTLEFLEGRFESASRLPDSVAMPPSIRQLVDQRLDVLKADDRATLNALSVYDREISLPLLQRITHMERSACIASLDRLQRLHLTSWTSEGVVLRHGLIRHAVYGNLAPPARALVHERVAWGLLDLQGSEHPDQLALHFAQAGISDQAVYFAMEAADHAEASGAVTEALHFLALALEHSDDPEVSVRIMERQGHLHYLHRNFEEAAPLLKAAGRELTGPNEDERQLLTQIRHLDSLSRIGAIPKDIFLSKLHQLKEYGFQEELWYAVAVALQSEVCHCDRWGNVDGVRSVLGQAEDLISKARDPKAQAIALLTLALHQFYGSPSTALNSARRAYQLTHDARLSGQQLEAAVRLLMVFVCQGVIHTHEAEEVIGVADSLIEQSGDLAQKFYYYANLAVWYTDIGLFATARRRLKEAERIISNTDAADLFAILHLSRGTLEVLQHNIETAYSEFQEASSFPLHKTSQGATEILTAGVGFCALYNGDMTTALAAAEELLPDTTHWFFDRTFIIEFKVRLLRAQGKQQEAMKLLQEATERSKDRFIPGWLTLKSKQATLMSETDEDSARNIVEDCLEVADALRLPRQFNRLRFLSQKLSKGR